MNAVTINHLSDLHIKRLSGVNYRRTKRLVEFILEHTPPEALTLITGDLVEDGQSNQYRAALRALRPLAQERHVIVAPGNHDYRDAGTFYSRGGRDRFADFREKLTKVSWGYPYVYDLGQDVRLHVLDSCATVDDYTSMAKGEVGYSQRLELVKQLDDDLHNIVALHHHPWERGFGLELEDSGEFLSTLSGRCAALLFGHKHAWEEWSDVYGIRRAYASGKVTDQLEEDGEKFLQFRQVTVEAGRVDARMVRVDVPSRIVRT